MSNKGLLSEFDEPSDPIPADIIPHDLPAAIADPAHQEAIIANPKTGMKETAPSDARLRWSRIPMPIRERAFFLWIEFGTYVEVANQLGMKVESVKKLSETDGWESRAEQLRLGLEKGFLVSILHCRQEASRLVAATIGNLDPARLAAMLDGKDAVRLLTSLLKDGSPAGGGLSVPVTGSGPTQINIGAQTTSNGPFSGLSDEELARQARARGIDVQAAPQALGSPPPSLSGSSPDSGETEVTLEEVD